MKQVEIEGLRLEATQMSLAHAPVYQDFAKRVLRLLTLVDRFEPLAMENAHLRILASKAGCFYGHYVEGSGCQLGYPGCACMDDHLALMAWQPEDEDKAAVRLGQRALKAERSNEILKDALLACAEQFAKYEAHHRAKTGVDAALKAARNNEMILMIDAALAKAVLPC